MSGVEISLAISHYDHVADLTSGRVPVEGARLHCLQLPLEEIMFRFARFAEWDVSEMSMGVYSSLVAASDAPMVAIPVFPSRVFRQSSFYVREGRIRDPSEIRGKRVGVPEWAQTASVYSRALLTHEYGIGLHEIDWYVAGVNQAGRKESAAQVTLDGVRVTRVPDRSLDEMLLAGELDVVLSAHAPDSFRAGDQRVVRLFDDLVTTEEDYAARTGVIPIMHVVVIRRATHESYPWLAANLLTAFETARDLSLARMDEANASRIPMLGTLDWFRRTKRIFGGTPWPYGVEPNRTTLEAFLRWAFEQGVTGRQVEIEELFVPQVLEQFRV